MPIKDDSNITRLTALAIIPDPDDPSNGLYSPNLTQAEIDAIPLDEMLPGGFVYNTDINTLQTSNADLEWINVITEGAEEVSFESLTVLSFHVTDHLTTKDLTVTDTANILTLVVTLTLSVPNLFVSDSIQTLDLTATGTIQTPDLVVINTAVVGALSVDNTGVFNSDINVAGFTELEADVRIGSFATGGTLAGSTDAGTANPHITVTPGSAVGTSPTVIIQGSPISGGIFITSGANTSGTLVATFTLPNTAWKQFSATWGVVLTASSVASSQLNYYVAAQTLATANTAATFTLNVDSGTPLADATNYWWNYHIIGNSDTA